MPKTRERKKKDIDVLKKYLEANKSVVLANFFGLKVKDVEALRRECRKSGLSVAVAKKTLLRRALKDRGIEAEGLQGEMIAVFGNDEVTPAKVSAGFAKGHESLKIVAGILDGKIASVEMIKALAKLPSKEELLSKLVGTLNAPVSGFVRVLSGNLRGLVCALNAIKNNKG